MRTLRFLLPLSLLLCACPKTPSGSGGGSTPGTPAEGGIGHPCSLPGAVQFTKDGTVTVPGGATSWPSLAYLHLPQGFCAHWFGNVGNARNLRFAPGGELFVASPTGITTGGGQRGQSAIIVLPDDDGDGVADAPITFLSGLPNTQGMMFSPGYFHYQDHTKIQRLAYKTGDRAPSGSPTTLIDITVYEDGLHWPKGIDIADDGKIYVSNGGSQAEQCVTPHPFHGGVLLADGTPGGTQVAQGLRNPMSVRCSRGHDKCFVTEMAMDYTAGGGGREKLIPIHQGDDWGHPCCATTGLPFSSSPAGTDCSNIASENDSFVIGDTPFSLAFAPSTWPAPYAGSAIVALHGAAGSWTGARVITVAVDPTTGDLVPGTNLSGSAAGGMSDFATGWDDNSLAHGRPSSVEFSADGRLFIGNDNSGDIFWIAPLPQ